MRIKIVCAVIYVHLVSHVYTKVTDLISTEPTVYTNITDLISTEPTVYTKITDFISTEPTVNTKITDFIGTETTVYAKIADFISTEPTVLLISTISSISTKNSKYTIKAPMTNISAYRDCRSSIENKANDGNSLIYNTSCDTVTSSGPDQEQTGRSFGTTSSTLITTERRKVANCAFLRSLRIKHPVCTPGQWT